MTKRTEIAVSILQGLASKPEHGIARPALGEVKLAFELADMVLEEEAKTHTTGTAPAEIRVEASPAAADIGVLIGSHDGTRYLKESDVIRFLAKHGVVLALLPPTA